MNKHKKIIFITDLEGRIEALAQACINSRSLDGKGLYLYERDMLAETNLEQSNWNELRLELDDDYLFVYGGDATDHNTADITVLRCLVELKEKYPERVTLIAGNRDLNKIRIKQELTESFIDYVFEALRKNPGVEPRWLEPNSKRFFQNFLKSDENRGWIKEVIGGRVDCEVEDYWNTLSTQQKQLLYLRWSLAKNLNSPKCFENRQGELHRRGLPSSQWDALESFLNEGSDLHYRYLKLGVLAHSVANVTFVHGGLTPGTFLTTLINEMSDHADWITSLIGSTYLKMGFKEWFLYPDSKRATIINQFLNDLECLSENDCRALKDFVFNAMNQEMVDALDSEYISLQPDQQFDDVESPIIARGKINRQSLPSEVGLVGYNHINRYGDVIFEKRWLTFLHKSGCWDNVSGHIPQGEHPRVVCQTVRFILVDTTFKQKEGIPNEDVLIIEFNDDGGHKITCFNSVENHYYPLMDSKGNFGAYWGETNLIWIAGEYLPEKYRAKSGIESHPWIIGPRVSREGKKGYLCTQKRGPEGEFKTYTLVLTSEEIQAIKDSTQINQK
ncbi:MAG: hypothetical protein CMF48_05150 [Legionellales bacterium]|nr:hypothetical protein [Legionellales bacterium]